MGMQEVTIKMNLDAQSVVSSAQNISDAFSNIIGKMKEAQETGNIDLASKYSQQAKSLQGLYNGMTSGGGGGGGGSSNIKEESASNANVKQVVSIANSAKNTVNTGIQQLGSKGDVMGATLTGLYGGMDIMSQLGDKAEKWAGIFGAALAPLTIKNSLSNFYRQQLKPSIDINGRLNNTERKYHNKPPSDNPEDYTITQDSKGNTLYYETESYRNKINTDNINKAFDKAAQAAIVLGYSMEEGMEVVKNATQHGYTSKDIYITESRILKWNRATGVDTGLLTDYLGRQYRFSSDKDGNSIAQAFQVNKQMGMERGQFSETLNALKTIFEDGISKGFVKSTAEIGSTLVTLYKASGSSKLWQGEEGARRYMQMSDAISNATALNSVSDILTYRAVNLASGSKQQALKNAGLKGKSYGYIDNMIVMEQGVNPDLLKAQKEVVESTAGKNNKAGQIELYKQMYGLNYTGATQVYELMQRLVNKNEKGEEIINSNTIANSIKAVQSDPGYISTQKAILKHTEQIRYQVADIGKSVTDTGEHSILQSLVNIMQRLAGGSDLSDINPYEFITDPELIERYKEVVQKKKKKTEEYDSELEAFLELQRNHQDGRDGDAVIKMDALSIKMSELMEEKEKIQLDLNKIKEVMDERKTIYPEEDEVATLLKAVKDGVKEALEEATIRVAMG